MATRGRASFQKRQKEIARKEKMQRKAARRAQRKLDGSDSFPIAGPEEVSELIDGVEASLEPAEQDKELPE